MQEALIIIDVQNDYFEGGAYPLHQPEKALANILLLIKKFNSEDRPVFFIRHISRSKDAAFFLADTDGARFHASLDPFLSGPHAYIIEKAYPNSFLQTVLQEKLQEQGVNRLVICGMMTHMCIDSTTRQAKELGYPVKLISDACATRDLSFGRSTVSAADVQNAFLSALSGFSEVESAAAYCCK
ncbi:MULTISPECIES: cysteine hydrolase family protein [unclassified Sporolactobacillus]|uniref:cysteine hydrolase family protein n=1 Tax=unclassified Sporolactobacillus TaxID=2628533 RepID=UPI002367F12B|nr:cysteine hydrolase family protein [Sporolactobacillus sp. CQH2019]MDD9149793.1 cysteine hydrolase family protein [Sporolactobacillus sp. CQH2019]